MSYYKFIVKKNKYILFHKPYGVLSQFTSDVHETLASFSLPKGVYPVGRLDKDSEGLLLLSNDGIFIEDFLLHHQRGYWAQVDRIPTQESIELLKNGVQLKTGLTKKAQVQLIESPGLYERSKPIRFRKNVPTSWLELILYEGKNRQVRRMTAQIGHPTVRLFRFQLGKLNYMQNKLAPGQWSSLNLSDI